MRINSKPAIALYTMQIKSSSTSNSDADRRRLREQVKRTREYLTNENSEEDFASILSKCQKTLQH